MSKTNFKSTPHSTPKAQPTHGTAGYKPAGRDPLSGATPKAPQAEESRLDPTGAATQRQYSDANVKVFGGVPPKPGSMMTPLDLDGMPIKKEGQ